MNKNVKSSKSHITIHNHSYELISNQPHISWFIGCIIANCCCGWKVAFNVTFPIHPIKKSNPKNRSTLLTIWEFLQNMIMFCFFWHAVLQKYHTVLLYKSPFLSNQNCQNYTLVTKLILDIRDHIHTHNALCK